MRHYFGSSRVSNSEKIDLNDNRPVAVLTLSVALHMICLGRHCGRATNSAIKKEAWRAVDDWRRKLADAFVVIVNIVGWRRQAAKTSRSARRADRWPAAVA